jgi:flagellar biosynthetic protein FliR
MTTLVWYFCLVLARVGAFVSVVPLLGGRDLPRTAKIGVTAALTLVWFIPMAESLPTTMLFAAASPPGAVGHLVAVGREVFIGAILGYGLGLFLVPAQIAGEYLTQEMGLSFGNQISPTGENTSGALTNILELMALALFFAADGHHIALGVLHATFTQYPLTGGLPDVAVPRLVAGVTIAQEWGLMLAAPVALLLFLTTITLAVLSRAAPQLNLYSVGFPMRLGAGLAACVLLLPAWVGAVVSGIGAFTELAKQMM